VSAPASAVCSYHLEHKGVTLLRLDVAIGAEGHHVFSEAPVLGAGYASHAEQHFRASYPGAVRKRNEFTGGGIRSLTKLEE